MLAAKSLRASLVAAGVGSQRRLLSASTRLAAASSHGHGHSSGHGAHEPESKLHPEEFAKIGREWPHEYHAPSNYAPLDDTVGHHLGNFGHTAENPTGEETVTTRHEDFSAPFWGRLVLAVIVGAGLYQVTRAYSRSDAVPSGSGLAEFTESTHPITEWFRVRMTSEDDIARENRLAIATQRRLADNRLISQHKIPTHYRFNFPGLFERKSDHLVEPGTEVDVSDLQFKHTWERDDELMGLPYPKDQ